MKVLLKISIKSLVAVFVVWTASLSLAQVISHNTNGDIGHAGYIFVPLVCLPPFAMIALVFIILLLIISHFVMKFILDMNEGILDHKSKATTPSPFHKIDNLLNRLSDDERTYLQRKLGTGELLLSDDGELLTLDEYRQRKENND